MMLLHDRVATGRRHACSRSWEDWWEAEAALSTGFTTTGNPYLFKHALIRDAAYETPSVKNTRQQYHQRIAQALEAQFPETAATQPELVAYHCMEAGLTAQSVSYWHTAAQRAIERSAHVEAISHLRTGLALLQTLPETP